MGNEGEKGPGETPRWLNRPVDRCRRCGATQPPGEEACRRCGGPLVRVTERTEIVDR
ncbi:MAG: hypothetical protein HY331_04550 [Chloroflexi bacterium]|nr:hypothetical protein [Chloroflexota bacterium]